MTDIQQEITQFKRVLDIWRAVDLTPAVRHEEAKRAYRIAEALTQRGDEELALRWLDVSEQCRLNKCAAVVAICMTLIPQTSRLAAQSAPPAHHLTHQ